MGASKKIVDNEAMNTFASASTQASDAIRIAYERGKIAGYAECFSDFRRIIREHGFTTIATPVNGSHAVVSEAKRRRLAEVLGRDPHDPLTDLICKVVVETEATAEAENAGTKHLTM